VAGDVGKEENNESAPEGKRERGLSKRSSLSLSSVSPVLVFASASVVSSTFFSLLFPFFFLPPFLAFGFFTFFFR